MEPPNNHLQHRRGVALGGSFSKSGEVLTGESGSGALNDPYMPVPICRIQGLEFRRGLGLGGPPFPLKQVSLKTKDHGRQ